MNKKDTNYRMPEGFDAVTTVRNAKALTDAAHQLVTEGEMTSRPAPQEAYASLVALMELLQPEVDALFYYLREIENSTTLDLPSSDEDFEALHVRYSKHRDDEVKETAAVYAIR
jgi:hypothetical protein